MADQPSSGVQSVHSDGSTPSLAGNSPRFPQEAKSPSPSLSSTVDNGYYVGNYSLGKGAYTDLVLSGQWKTVTGGIDVAIKELKGWIDEANNENTRRVVRE